MPLEPRRAEGDPQGRISSDRRVWGARGGGRVSARRCGLPPQAIASALGIAGSMASGIIEYLAEGTWTKRMHAGWAAQSGLRAALAGARRLRRAAHRARGHARLLSAFAPSVPPDFEPLLGGLGRSWVMEHDRVQAVRLRDDDAAVHRLRDRARAHSGVRAGDIATIVCDVAEGTVHRLWEPLACKQRPPTPYAAKFSTPYCMAVGFLDRQGGVCASSPRRASRIRAVLALAAKIRYAIDPDDEYPRNFTGHLRATLHGRTQREIRQPYMRGGAHAPLATAEVEAKFMDNVVYGGWSRDVGERFTRDCPHDVFFLTRPRRHDASSDHDRSATSSQDVSPLSRAADAISAARSRSGWLRAGAAVVVNARAVAVLKPSAVARRDPRDGRPRRRWRWRTSANPEAVAGLVEAAVRDFGRLDILVNNAGVREEKPNSPNLDYQEWREIVATILDGGISVQPRGAAAPRRLGQRGDRQHRRAVVVYGRARAARTSSPRRRVSSG